MVRALRLQARLFPRPTLSWAQSGSRAQEAAGPSGASPVCSASGAGSDEAASGEAAAEDAASGFALASGASGAFFASGPEAGAGRRRIENRVTASTKATSRAARPASWAPTTGALSGRAEVSAASRALALPFALADGLEELLGDGFSVGKRPDAFPPGLSVAPVLGLLVGTPGRVPTGIGEVDGVGDVTDVVPLIATVAAAFGSVGRLAALPMTTSRTDFTDDAVAGTGASASSCRCADFASIAPRSHDADPSLLPQPKLNRGVTLAGVACRRTVASGTFPPLVHALITH